VKVVFVSSEVAPFSKSGGLADVAGALPAALVALGVEVTVVTPLYQTIDRTHLVRRMRGLGVPLGGDRVHADIWELTTPAGVRILFLDPPGFFERPFLYGPPGGEYADNGFRFAFLSRAALEVSLALGLSPDIFHCNDWHTGLLPLFLKKHLSWTRIAHAKTVFTIHNLGYQGVFPHDLVDVLDLGSDAFHPGGLEFHGRVSYLKSGLVFSDALTTVSPTYAREIQGSAQGYGMDGAVRSRAHLLHGILNGIDTKLWDPARDPFLPGHFSKDDADLGGKAVCKAALQADHGLRADPHVPLFAVISRLAWQKGWDLFEPVADALIGGEGVQLVVLGTGEARFEAFFNNLALRYPGQVQTHIGFDEGLAHRIEAGADLFLMPSRYEPCGLNQMYSLRYGTLPVVRATGGLEDTVVDEREDPARGDGFKFRSEDPGALLEAAVRGAARIRDPASRFPLVRRAMAKDFSWDRAARDYANLYENTHR